MSDRSVSPLVTLERCFRLLCNGPGALTVDGWVLHEKLAARPIPLDELRSRLHVVPLDVRSAVVSTLLKRARAGSAPWQVGLAGLLLPGLRRLLAERADHAMTAAEETRVLTWFHELLVGDEPTADQSIEQLLDATCAAGNPPRD